MMISSDASRRELGEFLRAHREVERAVGLLHRVRVGVQPTELFGVGAGHPGRRVLQSVAFDVLADGDEQLTNGCLGARLVEESPWCPRHLR